MWCSEVRTFSGPVVEPVHDVLDLLRCQPVEACSFREIPADQTVGVFVQPSLPGMAGVSKDPPGIAKLLAVACEALEKAGLCRHFGGVIGPEAERIAAGVAV